MPTGEKMVVESKRCVRAPTTWVHRGGVVEYATKVGEVLGQKLCNITRVEMPIGVRVKAQENDWCSKLKCGRRVVNKLNPEGLGAAVEAGVTRMRQEYVAVTDGSEKRPKGSYGWYFLYFLYFCILLFGI